MASNLTLEDAIGALENKKGGKKGKKKGKGKNVDKESDATSAERVDMSEESLEKMLEFGTKKIDNCVMHGEPIDDEDFKLVIFLALFGPNSKQNVLGLVKKVSDLQDQMVETNEKIVETTEKVTELDENFKEMDKKMISFEVESYSNKFLLKNVPLSQAQTEKEKFSDTQKTVENILHHADLDVTSLDEFFRFYLPEKRNDRNEMKPPNIFLKFSNKKNLYQFIGKLGDIKKIPEFKDIQLEKMIPSCLIESWNKANKTAYTLRKDRKMKTKTEIRNDEVILYAKKFGDECFSQIDFD